MQKEIIDISNHNIIAIDCDEVLSNTLQAGLDLHNGQIVGKSYVREDISHYNFHEYIEGCTQQDSINFFHGTFENDIERLEIPPFTEALPILSGWKEAGKRLYVVTARPDLYEDYTSRWLEKHFPNIFEDILFGSHFMGEYRHKSDLCREVSATLLIEDNHEYALEVAEAGLTTILIEQPWNKHQDVSHENVYRVAGWEALSTTL